MNARGKSLLLRMLCPAVLLCSTTGHAQLTTISWRITVQPIVVIPTGGTAPSQATDQANWPLFEAETDRIFAQAGVDVQFLPYNTYADTSSLNQTTGGFGTFNSLATNPGHGQYQDNPYGTVVNLWFVSTLSPPTGTLGYSLQSSVNGVGNVTLQNGCSIATAAYSPWNDRAIFAHELGHNLGLYDSATAPDNGATLIPSGQTGVNVMTETTFPQSLSDIYAPGLNPNGLAQLTAAQVSRIHQVGDNWFLQPITPYTYTYSGVPEPGHVGLVTGLGLSIWGMARRRRVARST